MERDGNGPYSILSGSAEKIKIFQEDVQDVVEILAPDKP